MFSAPKSTSKGQSHRARTFDPEDSKRVKHTRIGVWDLYEEKQPIFGWDIPGTSTLEYYLEITRSLPYVWQMLKDMSSIQNCWIFATLYVIVGLALSVIPAASLWYSGQLLTIIQTAIDTRTVDKDFLVRISAGRTGCAVLGRLLGHAKASLAYPLSNRLKQHYTMHLFHARARLDLPTFEDPAVRRQIEEASHSSRGGVAWDTFSMMVTAVSTAINITSEVSMLVAVLKDQPDGTLLAVICLSQSFLNWFSEIKSAGQGHSVWAATTRNQDYVKMRGLMRVVSLPEHRKEFVAGNLAEYCNTVFREATQRVGYEAGDFPEVWRHWKGRRRLSFASIFKEPWKELPQIVFTLRSMQSPASIPASLASLNLIQTTASNFGFTVYAFAYQFGSIADQLATVRKLYDIVNIPNRIPDGTVPFPEDAQKAKAGIDVEFRNVSFRYPDSEIWALRNVSFKLIPGQLGVIVGANGSGKSTVLKLIMRLYDVEEGEILIDGRDIRTLKLGDLRQSVSVLFQDYTHFPLSIRDNIALGNPSHAANDDQVRLAAKLGGAEEFIERLPEGFDTYLERPVPDHYSALPEGTKTIFGNPVKYGGIRRAADMQSSTGHNLSGGQMQRLAVARTFMRSMVSEDSTVGLLLFDEPSASLDPTAEHGALLSTCACAVGSLSGFLAKDLFERLRQLRGDKTMLFSSHRFGSLTRHADLILYMNDSVIEEAGIHSELLARDGGYARTWKLQAQAFI
ncbi:P-loop containing nucleoside triphosphate hydrolase protein [Daedalea quercina L-15889]|uniref:p-loop containing nucleoside triphosphate hydrolase protein n=1 Tax=Daedalea quercina L-15889 TaxID=1314783 RepID=A0A165PXS0_9APHY|nr:P-loop containing nucleoside triphosphate hydrolase protein [Daedalea quercina L-15889]